jgi:hypothetical protein
MAHYEDIDIDEEIIDTSPLNESHAYDVYNYENFTLAVSPDVGKGSSIFQISLKTPVFETARGIKVGDRVSDITEKYGDSLNYSYEGKYLTFDVVETGLITWIQLDTL